MRKIETTLTIEEWETLQALRSKVSKTEKDLENIETLEDKEYFLYLQNSTMKVSQKKWAELKPARDRAIQEKKSKQFATNLSIATKQAEEKFLKNKESFTLENLSKVLTLYKLAETSEKTVALKRVCLLIASKDLS